MGAEEARRPRSDGLLARRAPGLAVLRRYRKAWLRPDVLAGVTVAAYLVPQCMAYAEIAGLPPIVGLWAVLAPMTIYALLGSSRHLSVGPESTTAILTATALGPLAAGQPDRYAALAAAAAVLVGVICLVGYGVRLGVAARLLSRPILIGYLIGVALTMIAGQLGTVLRIDVDGGSARHEVLELLGRLDEAHEPTLALSLALLVLLFVLQRVAPKAPGPLIAVMVGVVAVAALGLEDRGLEVVGSIPAGLPHPSWPDVELADLRALLPAAVGIALVGYSDNVLTSRAFDQHAGTRSDPEQELLALGAANIGTGLFGGFPVSSSGSRTVIAATVGAKTQAYSLVAAATVVATIVALRPLLESFPSAALGSLVVYAAIKLIDLPALVALWRFRRSELALAVATTVGVLATDILIGVAIAIALSVVDLLAHIARPHDAILGKAPGVAGWHDVDDWPKAATIDGLVLYRYDAPLFFANAEDFRASALRALEDADAPRWFVLQAEAIARIDSTAAAMLSELVDEIHRRGVTVAVAETKHELRGQFDRAGLSDQIGPTRLFPTLTAAVKQFQREHPEA